MTSFLAFPALRHAVPAAVFSSQARLAARLPAICATLPAGQAVTLQPRQAGLLRVVQGGIWLTFNPAAGDEGPALPGDHFLACGDSVPLAAGQAVVAEFWGPGASAGNAAACLAWETAPATGWPTALAAAARAAGGLIRPRPGPEAWPQRR